ncbi:hypothetical protein DQ04_05811010 [Trypanosoma grayi]|uniref:hypothetical protein n=1 Tax=Trypanosoma grayi TaxID=71804 RepID=UPI0004F48672|nr:hypothetical protein DQ04_05811010 [Trypanosoma grayi]KEG09104.1 hypothetical protein DQ04_05811010 [Trypanosoma grayi]
MNAESRADRVAEELASRVAQRSTLSSNAAPFIPSYLRSQAVTTESQQQLGSGGPEPVPASVQSEIMEKGLEEFYCNSDTYTQLPSHASLATTAAVASSALATFSGMTEDQLRQLEEYLWDPTQDENGTLPEDGRLFVNDDDGMGAEEEAWLIEQMMESDAAKQEADAEQAVASKKAAVVVVEGAEDEESPEQGVQKDTA